jgi:hypothetical protein
MNKKLIIILTIGLVIVAAAAFVGGRLLNGGFGGPLGMMPFGLGPGGGGQFTMSVNVLPAPELPKTPSDLTGSFVERKDNVITIQSFPMNGEGGGVAVFSTSSGDNGGASVSSADMSSGPKQEVVITGKTIIYRDSTEMVPPSSDQANTTIQQTVEIATLDDLSSQTMVQVWGRKNGDRIIADIIMFSTPIMIQRK